MTTLIRTNMLRLVFMFLFIPVGFSIAEERPDRDAKPGVAPTDFGQSASLPRPSSMPIGEFQEVMHEFLRSAKYKELGWQVDKGIRDTGPFIRNWNYGTHHTVRIFYSPEVMQWLAEGRQGEIPDGAVIIKEQYGKEPAEAHQGKSEEQMWESLKAWTIMIKDSEGSYDGWFWANPAKASGGHEVIDNHQYPYNHKDAGFGLYCIRCHAVTESPAAQKEYTFSSLRNVADFPGHPVLFRVDQTWRTPPPKTAQKQPEEEDDGSHTRCLNPIDPTQCPTRRSADFLAFYDAIPEQSSERVLAELAIPPVTHDHVVRAPADKVDAQGFITSDQCMSCHAGLLGEYGPVMFAHTEDPSKYVNGMSKYGGKGIDYSPYGEWRWSPMGLAGRDPIFFAQLETELAILAEEFADDPEKKELISTKLMDTCLRCHGAAGKHQFDLDKSHAAQDSPLANAHFSIDNVLEHNEIDEMQTQADRYGALARDGINCTICHRMQQRPQESGDDRPYLQHFLETSITGNIYLGPPGELYGPYKDKELSPYPMEHGIGFKPKHSEYIQSSQMCGSCHTVNLPIVDYPYHDGDTKNELAAAESVTEFQDFHHHVEQATYLEWLNSGYENEFNTQNPKGQSCQDCHMSKNLESLEFPEVSIDRIQTQIAIIQDTGYPDAENLAPLEMLQVRRRDEYSRHNFSGLNMFLVEMFNQFDKELGVRKVDYMTGTEQIPHAKDNFLLTASKKTATVKVEAVPTDVDQIDATVLVTSKVGHRFPSGVGFRRAFLEVVAEDQDGNVVWGSGRTNSLGVIVDEQGQPLKTEFMEMDASGEQQYQPHHQVIDSQDQVQIYETLLHTRGGKFTTSFIHGCVTIKDNRLLPWGWTQRGPNPEALTGEFLKATFPRGEAAQDPQFADGSGTDQTLYRIQLPTGVRASDVTVRATLYYQSIPPYFLKTIFDTAPNSPAAQRLHYICSNLDLVGTPMEDWKLKVVSDEQKVGQ